MLSLTCETPPSLQGKQTNLVTNEYTTAADADAGWRGEDADARGPGVDHIAYTVSNGTSTQTDVTDPRGHIRRVTFNAAGYTLSDMRALGETEEQKDSSSRPIAGNFVTSHTNTNGVSGRPTVTRWAA